MKVVGQSDAELLTSAREGDEAAFTELYVRHHAAAQRLAQGYRRLGDPDDLVNGAFERVLAALGRGNGPTDSFRAYLFVTLRRLAMEQAKHADDESLDEVPEPVAAVVGDPDLAGAERDIIAQAFESLPGPWQTVLWQTAVEGKQPKDFAGTMGMTPNAAAALAYRARERLRQAYLQAHLKHGAQAACEPHRSRLGGYIRGGLSWRQERATRDHLADCTSCAELADELSDVNRMLVRTVAPVFVLASGKALVDMVPGAVTLGATARLTGAAASTAGSPFGGAGAGGVGGALTNGRRLRAVAGALVAAAATAVALSVTLLPHDGGPAGRDPQVDVETDAGPDSDRASSTTTTRPDSLRGPTTTAAPAPATTAPTPASSSADSSADDPASSPTTTAPTTSVSAGVDVGVGVDVGAGGVQAQAQVDLQLAASWVPNTLGGTLKVAVTNRGQVTADNVKIDVSFGANSGLSGPAMGCQTSPTGIVSGVISLLREVTCPLLAITGGGTTNISFPAMLTVDSSATVTLSYQGRVVTSRTVSLT